VLASPNVVQPPDTPPRLTVALTFDHDAISSEVDRSLGPVALSRGEFGPRVGMPRVLALLAERGIEATFFVPGHTAVSFPESVAAIVAAGHELACHGWAHEERAAGVRPVGFRAPFWSLSERTLELVEELGFVYDSSLMADDVRLYRVRRGDAHDAREGSRLGPPGRLVEVPVTWALDDWPLFEPSPGAVGPMSAPSKVEEIWREEFLHAWEHEPGGLFTLTMHPEAIGRGSRIRMLERLVDFMAGHDGVRFARLDRAVADWLAAGEPGR
jgi:peptidoglycan/xylan/chitin deacetylase (PgdA/CDA1 family)